MPILKTFRLRIKYLLDKFIASMLLVMTSPVFLVTAIVLKLKGEDIFFLQKRVGHNGKDFFVYKFTTMPKGSEKLGMITTANDPRPFKFGKFLRKSKLNEFPQLINVMNGTMSLVGPRPLIREQLEELMGPDEIKSYYSMRPGITGAGTLYYHHEDRLLTEVSNPLHFLKETIIPQKQRLEKEYAEKWSLLLDIGIFIKTMMILFIDPEKLRMRNS